MSGVKGRSGGARRGTSRAQQRLRLSLEYAKKLAILVGHRRSFDPTTTPEKLVELWIENEWITLDTQYQKNAQESENLV